MVDIVVRSSIRCYSGEDAYRLGLSNMLLSRIGYSSAIPARCFRPIRASVNTPLCIPLARRPSAPIRWSRGHPMRTGIYARLDSASSSFAQPNPCPCKLRSAVFWRECPERENHQSICVRHHSLARGLLHSCESSDSCVGQTFTGIFAALLMIKSKIGSLQIRSMRMMRFAA